jgi:hypothetical protein
MKKTLLLLSFLTFSTIAGYAQALLNNGTSFTMNLFLKEVEKDSRQISQTDTKLEGSPYLKDEFEGGEVITLRGTFNPVNMRYNIYEDAMEFNMGGRNLAMDPTALIKSITLDRENFVVADFPFQKAIVRGFVVELVAGNIGLYAKKNISYREATPPKALESAPHPPKMVRLSDTYYLNRPNEAMVKVSGTKDIMELLSGKSAILKKYVKQEKLANKNVEDMAKLVSYANSL